MKQVLVVVFLGLLALGLAEDNMAMGERVSRATTGQTDFGQTAIKKILAKHNEYRASVSPSASNMKYMTWDPVLATMAQRWAERCRFEHPSKTASNPSSFDSVGQNLHAREGSPNREIAPEVFVRSWYSEVSDYDYHRNNCPVEDCGHYTQLVWADSNKIGCGKSYCRSISGSSSGWLIVCNYGPGGNFYDTNGQMLLPYQTGERCSQCDDDAPFCYRGLCHQCNPRTNSDCVCSKVCKNCGTLNPRRCTCSCANGFLGSDCGEICRDTHRYCGRNPGWPNKSFCSFDPMVPIGCPLMCGQCKARDRNFSCANPNGSSSRPRPSTGGGTVSKLKKTKKKNKKGKKNKKRGGKKKKGRRQRAA